MTESVKLVLTGHSKLLVRGCRYVYPGEVYECSAEEAEVRNEQEQGVWRTATEKELASNEEVTPAKEEVTPAKEDDTSTKEDATPAKEEPTPVQKKTPEKKVGDKVRK